eukprot:123309-Chlamydomonas_euryale.AAC.1
MIVSWYLKQALMLLATLQARLPASGQVAKCQWPSVAMHHGPCAGTCMFAVGLGSSDANLHSCMRGCTGTALAGMRKCFHEE